MELYICSNRWSPTVALFILQLCVTYQATLYTNNPDLLNLGRYA